MDKQILDHIEERLKTHEAVAHQRFDRIESLLQEHYMPRREIESVIQRLEKDIEAAKQQENRNSKIVNQRIDVFEKTQKAFVTKLVTGLSLLMTALGAFAGSLM